MRLRDGSRFTAAAHESVTAREVVFPGGLKTASSCVKASRVSMLHTNMSMRALYPKHIRDDHKYCLKTMPKRRDGPPRMCDMGGTLVTCSATSIPHDPTPTQLFDTELLLSAFVSLSCYFTLLYWCFTGALVACKCALIFLYASVRADCLSSEHPSHTLITSSYLVFSTILNAFDIYLCCSEARVISDITHFQLLAA